MCSIPCSLTQKTSLMDLEYIRKQIYQIKNGDEVCPYFLASWQWMACADIVCPNRTSLWSSSELRWIWYGLIRFVNAVCDALTHAVTQRHEREVSSETIQDMAMKWGVPFYETSAKRGWDSNKVFHYLLGRMHNKYPGGEPKGKKGRRVQCVIM